jgi:hypothetical protein
MLQTILSNWNTIRVLRLVLGLLALGAAFSEHDKLMGLLGTVFTLQAVFNVGCCGSSGCSTNYKNDKGAEEKEIIYETIKK